MRIDIGVQIGLVQPRALRQCVIIINYPGDLGLRIVTRIEMGLTYRSKILLVATLCQGEDVSKQ